MPPQLRMWIAEGIRREVQGQYPQTTFARPSIHRGYLR
jgi:hypothetical protein